MAICFKFIIAFCLITNPLITKFANAKNQDNLKILIMSEDAEPKDYYNFLNENNFYIKSTFDSISNNIANNISSDRPDDRQKTGFKNKASHISNLKILAEVEFLDEDITKSINTYKKIISFGLAEVWGSDTKSTIFQSYFRLAQLEKDKEKLWIQKALDFASDLRPSSSLTPIGLKNTFEKIRFETSTNQIEYIKLNLNNPKSKFSVNNESKELIDFKQADFKQDYLNQIHINSSKNISIVNKNSLYRLDFISDTSLPSVAFVKGSNISGYKPVEIKFNGLCENLETSSDIKLNSDQILKFENYYIYSSTDCEPISASLILNRNNLEEITTPMSDKIIIAQDKQAQSSKSMPNNLPQKSNPDVSDLSNTNYNLRPSDRALNTFPESKYSDGQSQVKKPRSTNKWIYIGSAVLAVTIGAMFLNQQNDSSEAYEPTRTKGF